MDNNTLIDPALITPGTGTEIIAPGSGGHDWTRSVEPGTYQLPDGSVVYVDGSGEVIPLE